MAQRWTDERPVDPAWTAPPAVRTGRNRQRPVLAVLAVAFGLAVVLVAVGALGGFGRRTDLRIPTAVGVPFTTGPYVFTFSAATAQQVSVSDQLVWEVTVIGTVANTGPEALTPKASLDPMFVVRDPVSRTTAEPDSARIGDGSFTDHSTVTPGLPAANYRLAFRHEPGEQLADRTEFYVFELEYGSTNLLDDEQGWVIGRRSFQLDLPLQVLPPKN